MGAYVVIHGERAYDEDADEDEDEPNRDDLKKYRQLHYETVAVLQVLVREADVKLGVYQERFLSGLEYAFDLDDFEFYTKIMRRLGKEPTRTDYANFLVRRAEEIKKKRADVE